MVSWALYDWANSAFAMVMIAGFFPLFFVKYYNAGVPADAANLRLGVANSAAALSVVILAPVLGAVADAGGLKKTFLLLFAAVGMLGTAALALVGSGQWLWAAALYVLASAGFMVGNVFYDALLVSVAERGRWHFVSALGYGLGYLGGGLMFAVCAVAASKPALFGFADAAAAVKASFVATALWWAVFSVPLLLRVREPTRSQAADAEAAMPAGFHQLLRTFQRIRNYRPVLLFLLAYWLYIDGVNTVIQMAVAYGASLGLGSQHLLMALLLVQFVAFPSVLVFGRLGQSWGAKRAIYVALGVYVGVCVWGFFLDQTWEFYGVAVMVGLVQGGVQSLSRSLYAGLVPAAYSGEFFGFYNMWGKFAALMGPLLFGLSGYIAGDVRYSMISVIVLFLGGAALLARVPTEEGAADAHPSPGLS